VSLILGTLLLAGRDSREPPTDATAKEVGDAPMAFVGQGVSMAGLVGELLTEQALTLRSDGEAVLVLVPPDAVINGTAPMGLIGTAGQVMASGDAIDVTGTVWFFDRDAMAEDLGLILHDRLFDPWEGMPVLVADQIDATGVTTETELTVPQTKEADP
jgi:hypothetical protein